MDNIIRYLQLMLGMLLYISSGVWSLPSPTAPLDPNLPPIPVALQAALTGMNCSGAGLPIPPTINKVLPSTTDPWAFTFDISDPVFNRSDTYHCSFNIASKLTWQGVLPPYAGSDCTPGHFTPYWYGIENSTALAAQGLVSFMIAHYVSIPPAWALTIIGDQQRTDAIFYHTSTYHIPAANMLGPSPIFLGDVPEKYRVSQCPEKEFMKTESSMAENSLYGPAL